MMERIPSVIKWIQERNKLDKQFQGFQTIK